MPRSYVLIFVSIVVASSLGLAFLLNYESYEVFPLKEELKTKIGISHEEVSKGYSIGNFTIDKQNELHFSYKLSKEIPEPFTSVYFYIEDSSKALFYDFSQYNLVTLYIKAQKAKRIPVFLTLDYSGFTSSGKALSWLPMVSVIDYTTEKKYHIRKSDFEIPSWWLRMHGMKKEDFNKIDFSRITHVLVSSCQTIGPGVEDEIVLKSITFRKDNRIYYYIYVAIIVITAFILSLIYIFKKKKKVLVPYQASEIESTDKSSKINNIVLFIAKNYINPELSSNDLQKALGISEREIGLLIKNNLDSSFKAYLNSIRLAEVKRLLLETDLPISDIAYRTGYNNIPHFNRLFKKEIGSTPKEFRDNGN